MENGEKWASDCILVSGLSSKISVGSLDAYFTKQEVSEGGPIAKNGICKIDDNKAVIQFVDGKDAARVLCKAFHKICCSGSVFELQVSKCPSALYKKYITKEEDFCFIDKDGKEQIILTEPEIPVTSTVPFQQTSPIQVSRPEKQHLIDEDQPYQSALVRDRQAEAMDILEMKRKAQKDFANTNNNIPEKAFEEETSEKEPFKVASKEETSEKEPFRVASNEETSKKESFRVANNEETSKKEPFRVASEVRNQNEYVLKPSMTSKTASINNLDKSDVNNCSDVNLDRQTTYAPQQRSATKEDKKERTVIVKGIKPELNIELLECYFENERSGGGTLETIGEYQQGTHSVVLVYVSKMHADRVLSKELHTVGGHNLQVRPYTDINESSGPHYSRLNSNDDNTSNSAPEEPIVVVVTDIRPGTTKDTLGLIFENEKKSGGGDIDSLEYDSSKGIATVKFKADKVAERVLSRKSVKFNGVEMKLSRQQKWNKRTVQISGFGNMSAEMLELLYENKNKTNGGPIESVVINKDDKGALITFDSKKDAANVLHKSSYTLRDGKTTLIARIPSVEPFQAVKSAKNYSKTADENKTFTTRSILVDGLDESVAEDHLENFFEDLNLSGGGPVESVDITDHEFGMAVVKFEDCKVAARVIARETLSFGKLTLRVLPKKEEVMKMKVTVEGAVGGSPTTTTTKTTTSTTDNKKSSKTGSDITLDSLFNSIEVVGISPHTHRDHVKFFFENHKQTGGGEIQEFDYNEQQGIAVIKFKYPKVVKSVMLKHKDSPLKLNEVLQIRPIDTSQSAASVSSFKSCALQVKGLPTNITESYLRLLFENEGATGGGKLEDVVLMASEGKAVLTFETPTVCQRVFDKHNLSNIYCEESRLDIQMLCSNTRPSQDKGPMEANTLMLKNVGDDIDTQDIINYLQRLARCQVSECVYAPAVGTVLVKFTNMPGYKEFYQLACQKPLKGTMIDIETVPRSKSIEVYGGSGVYIQTMMLYFEHPKAEGGDTEEIQRLTDIDCTIITFKDYGVAERVVRHGDHKLHEIDLKVKMHYPCLGPIPPNFDYQNPQGGLPKPVTININQFSREVLHYILSTQPNKKYVEDAILEAYGKVEWPPDFAVGYIKIHCLLKRSMQDFKSKAKTWPDIIETVLIGLLTEFNEEKIDVLNDAWQELKDFCMGVTANVDDARVDTDDRRCTLTAIGKQEVVQRIMGELKQKKQEIETKLRRRTQVGFETVRQLNCTQIRFLLAHKFPQNMKQKYGDLKVEPDMKNSIITFTGVSDDIINAKLQMFELVNLMVSQKFSVQSSFITLLQHQNTKEYVISKFEQKKIIAVWEADTRTNEITAYAKSSGDLHTCVSVMKKVILVTQIHIAEESRAAVNLEIWSVLMGTLLNDYYGRLIISVEDNDRCIHITACDPVMSVVSDYVNNFLRDNTIVTQFINMNYGTMKLLQCAPRSDLNEIEEEHKNAAVNIEAVFNRDKPGFKISGTQEGTTNAVTKLKSIANSVICYDHHINKPGMPKYFNGDRGKSHINALQTTYKVAIETEKANQDLISVEDFAHTLEQVNRTVIKSKVTQPGGCSIFVVQGNLTDYRVDAIVNAANEELKHSAGLAKAIVDKGGLEIQEECSSHVMKTGKLLTGQVYVSKAGRLPCKRILHAVGPTWHGGNRNEENILYEAVYKSLQTASTNGLASVAMPAISAGIYQFPLKLCCVTIVNAVRDFLKLPNHLLREVHLVDSNERTMNTFHEALITTFGIQNVRLMNDQTQSQSRPAPQLSATNQNVADWTEVDQTCIETKEGVRVKLVKGDIAKQRNSNIKLTSRFLLPFINQCVMAKNLDAMHLGFSPFQTGLYQVDVIVNSTRKDLKLDCGGVSAAILKAGGSVVQAQCKQKAPGGVPYGDIVVTDGGNLHCKKVYHGACSNYTDAGSVMNLKKLVSTSITQAHNYNTTSIALPAIGTKQLGFPRDLVAKEMFEKVKQLSHSHRGTTLKDIRFIVYDKDAPTITAFQAEMDRLKGPRSPPPREIVRNRPQTHPQHNSNRRRDEDVGATGGAPQSNDEEVYLENCVVSVLPGDITKESTDAIVNSTTDKLILNSQVSRAIIKAGGIEIEQECKAIGKTNSKHIAVTGSGRLPCKKIIYVDVPEDGFRSSSKWKSRIKNILEEAEKLQFVSISFPALGTGVQHIDAGQMANSMFEAIREFNQTKPVYVKIIRVVVFENRYLRPFREQLQKLGEKKRGLGARLAGAFSSTSNNTQDTRNRNVYQREEQPAHIHTGQDIHHSKMTFHIYGKTQAVIDEVVQKINAFCNEESQDHVIEKETIAKLSDSQIAQIKQLQTEHHVRITIDKGARLNRIRIQGQHTAMTPVLDAIWAVFREIDHDERDRSEADLIARQVQWQYQHNGRFVPYPVSINLRIEKAYREQRPFAKWQEKDGFRDKNMQVFFQSNLEINIDRPGSEVPVRRFTPDSVEVPADWQPMSPGEPYKMITLIRGNPEFHDVEQKFRLGMQQRAFNSVKKIQKLQNPSMYKKYIVHRCHLEVANPPAIVNEKQLWHGTSAATINEINTSGFNRNFAGVNGTAHGKGVYFATYASLSAGYAIPDANKDHHMYLCKVLTGEYCKSKPDYRVPPAKDASKPNIKYDSVVDNVTSPKIYVIFSDTQSYPEYLITYN